MTEVEIVNAALALIGEDEITALTDTTNRAKLANRIYAQERDAVLRAHEWNFAIKRAALTVDAIAPSWGFDYRFPLPTDPTDLVSNGGFASATTGWTGTNGTLASVAGGETGNCLEITRTGESSQLAYQAITTEIGKVYLLTASVKSGSSGAQTFRLDFGVGTATMIGTSSATWTAYTLLFKATAVTHTIRLIKDTVTAGTMLFDTVSVVPNEDVYCLRVLEMEDATLYGEDWRIEGRYILTDESTCNIRYIARITDTTEFDTLYVDGLMYRLAASIALGLKTEPQLAKEMLQIYRMKLVEARGINADERYQVADNLSPLANVR